MVFSSATFLLAFLPITLFLYFLIPSRAGKNITLLIASIFFYAWGEPVYVLLMIASIISNWGLALAIAKSGTPTFRRTWLIVAVFVNLSLLGFFKYEGFLADNINTLLGSAIVPNLELPLPIGISFFSLQAVSYVVDVYRNTVRVQRNLLYMGMYISMFPQLIAGPIVRYETIQDQILNRKETLEGFCAGLRLFIVGLAKKVLLANVIAILAAKMLDMGGANIGAIGAWSGLIAFTFQIFFDFSGYSDMAIGLGKMFGFQYLRNFNYPYISKSVTEFWRRWHISLSSFFRDYVYIPLGGSRVSKFRWCVNICIVWGLTGFWHGAAWNYIGWGIYYGITLLAEKIFLSKQLSRLPTVMQHIYCITVFLFGWLIFWIEEPSEFVSYLSALFGGYGLLGSSTFWELTAWQYWPVFICCTIASTPLIPWVRAHLVAWAHKAPFNPHIFMEKDLPNEKTLGTDTLCSFTTAQFESSKRCHTTLNGSSSPEIEGARKAVLHGVGYLVDLTLLGLLAWSVISVASGSFNPFIYFRF